MLMIKNLCYSVEKKDGETKVGYSAQSRFIQEVDKG